MSDAVLRQSATVIPFPFARIAGPRLTGQDRAVLQAWEARAGGRGYVQTTICDNDLVMICLQGVLWTVRVAADAGRRFRLSRHGAAASAGHFATLAEALAVLIEEVPQPMPGESSRLRQRQ